MKLLLFLFALTVVAAAGGFLLYYASQHPMLVSTKEHSSSPNTQTDSQTLPVPKPVQAPPSRSNESPAETDHEGEERVEAVDVPVPAGEPERNEAETPVRKDIPQALSPEPASEPSQTALKRVEKDTAKKRFQDLMSAGMAALHRGDYYVAQDAFIKAKGVKPDSPEVKDALTQVDAAVRLNFINDLKKAAAAAEQGENWRGALDSYTEVLKIDGTLQFALDGKTHSTERILMEKRLRYYIDQPGVLASESSLQTAKDLLEQAEAVSLKGPRLRSQIDSLGEAIQLAQTPVKVILKSDNFTEVAVYKVGKFGKFKEKELRLRPGTYTIVGIRNGYKDARQTVKVTSAGQPIHITIQCEETL